MGETGSEVGSLWDDIISQFPVSLSSGGAKWMYSEASILLKFSNAFARTGPNKLILIP